MAVTRYQRTIDPVAAAANRRLPPPYQCTRFALVRGRRYRTGGGKGSRPDQTQSSRSGSLHGRKSSGANRQRQQLSAPDQARSYSNREEHRARRTCRAYDGRQSTWRRKQPRSRQRAGAAFFRSTPRHDGHGTVQRSSTQAATQATAAATADRITPGALSSTTSQRPLQVSVSSPDQEDPRASSRPHLPAAFRSQRRQK